MTGSEALPYYKRYPRDFLEGTVGMPLELKGAYGLLLDIMYMQPRDLPDDPHYISGLLGCSVRKWNCIRKDLIERGKIACENGIISNTRADKEKIIRRKYRDNQAENASKPRKNKDLEEATADKARGYCIESEPEPEENSEQVENPERIVKFDPRDIFANCDEFVFDERKWFTENETAYLEDLHPKINVRQKLDDESFRRWAFEANPTNPLIPARSWFEKQKRTEESLQSLYATRAEIATTGGIGDISHLFETLDKRGH